MTNEITKDRFAISVTDKGWSASIETRTSSGRSGRLVVPSIPGLTSKPHVLLRLLPLPLILPSRNRTGQRKRMTRRARLADVRFFPSLTQLTPYALVVVGGVGQ